MQQSQTAIQEQPISTAANQIDSAGMTLFAASPAGTIYPQACASCGNTPAVNGRMPAVPPCIYVIGHIEPRFPLLSIEKETRQVIARGASGKEMTDREIMARLLRDPANKYLVRRLCWVLSVQGVETYILMPRDGDYQPLIDAFRAEPNPGDLE